MKRTSYALALALFLGAVPAGAQNDSAKKSGDGVGSLFKGIGQEIGKATGSSTAPKKDAKKSEPAKPDAKKD